jgi:hypothetical protein
MKGGNGDRNEENSEGNLMIHERIESIVFGVGSI